MFFQNGAHLWIHFAGQELVFDQTLFGQHRLQSFLVHMATSKWSEIIHFQKQQSGLRKVTVLG